MSTFIKEVLEETKEKILHFFSPPFPNFNKVNDLSRIAYYAANDVYLTNPKDMKISMDTLEIDDHQDHMIDTTGKRIYQITRYIYHDDEQAEFSCIYTAENDSHKQKYAFIAWKGTDSKPQAFEDFKCIFETEDSWREKLTTITDWFLPKISNFLKENHINASSYEWYTTGHSLGGALAIMAGDQIRLNKSIINDLPLMNTITFASMKVPETVLPQDGDYSAHNQVIEFYNEEDRLPEMFCPQHSTHVGHPRININLCLPFHIPHQLENFDEFFLYHYVEIKEDGSFDILLRKVENE